MNFLFSSAAGRLKFLGRCVLTILVLLLGALPAYLINVANPTSKAVLDLAFIFAALVTIPTLYYFMRFVIIARLRSIGWVKEASLFMLVPFLVIIFQELKVSLPRWAIHLPWNGLCISLLAIFALFFLALIIFPEGSFMRGSAMQSLLHDFEVGEGRAITYIVPLIVTLSVICGLYDFGPISTPLGPWGGIYRGLNDAQSMDNAQLARQIARGAGFTTMFLRPYAVAQLHDYNLRQSGSGSLFPGDTFPPGTPRILPDTYNAPGYPYLLAAWFRLLNPQFDETPAEMVDHPIYRGDLWIPELNQIFIILTALFVFGLGYRLFDKRVAWVAAIAFLVSDMVWQYSITGLSTTFLMFLVTGLLFSALEIFRVAEASFTNDDVSWWPAFFWAFVLGLFLTTACLTRLPLLVLLVPLMAFLALLPRLNVGLLLLVAVMVIGLVAPWFLYTYKVSGNLVGSNMPLLLYGEDAYKGNQIYCTTFLPSYERLFRAVDKKEFLGFRWHFEHAWELLGSNPMILFFGASILYAFKQRRVQAFKWLLVSCAICVIALNNLGVAQPEAIGPWNTVVVLFPCMLVIGSAFFFILLDRLDLPMHFLSAAIVVTTILLTAMPLMLTLTTSSNKTYNYPPYLPADITELGQFAHPDEWVTSDMPWATAWYANHASLWLPNSIADFEKLHDNICPTGILIITPVTLDAPAINLTSGEYKDWLPFISNGDIPAGFPLKAHTVPGAGGPEYSIWSDRERWH